MFFNGYTNGFNSYLPTTGEFKQEFFNCGEEIINGSALLDKMEYIEWLKKIRRNNNTKTVRADWVIADTFFAIRKSDSRIIGMIDIRHSIDNDLLSKYGGHISYAVRPSERRKGYATQMLKMALIHILKALAYPKLCSAAIRII